MSASGFTPIQLYRSTTAAAVPLAANLAAGELAINLTDEKLYFENASGVVKVLADSTYVGTVTSVAASGGTTGLTFTGSPITSSGTLTLSGTLAATNGGTGQSSYAIGDLLFASTTTALSKLADVATGNALISGGVGVAPLYGKIGLTTHVSGTLAVGNGGIGATTLTANGVLVGNGTSAVSATAVGTTGQVLVGNTGAAPTWATLTSTAVTSFSAGTTGLTPSTATQGAITLAGTLAVANGGTGQTTYTNGQLLIGNTTGNTLTKATLTPGTGVSITNGTGSITISATGSGGTVTSVDASGGTTGMTFSGGPVTGIGTLTLAGTLAVANGGTGTATAFTAGSVVFAGASGVYSQDNANLFWDNTNDRLGIGTASPSAKLEVNGTGFVAASISGDSTSETQLRFNTNTSARISQQANQALIFDTNANERMRITSAGNVGIGESTPGAKLHVSGGVVGTTAGNLVNVTIDQGGAGANVVGIRTNLVRVSNGTDWTTTAMRLQGRVDATDFGYIDLVSGGAQGMAFGSSTSERMRIDASGNVMIGTTSATGLFSVAGVSYGQMIATDRFGILGNNLYFGGGGGGNFRYIGDGHAYGWTQGNTDGADLRLLYAGNNTSGAGAVATTSERIYITAAGNVGIGTSSPGAKLDVLGISLARTDASGGNSPLVAKNDNTGNNTTKTTGLLFQGVDTVGTGKSTGLVQCGPADANYVASYLAFQTRTADALFERMRITSDGNVGIGTSGPGYRLDIAAGDTTAGLGYAMRLRSNATATAATIQFTTSTVSTQNGIITCTDTGAMTIQTDGASSVLAFRTNGSERLRILNTGGITSGDLADAVGYKGVPQNSQTASYTLALSDMGKHISITTGGVVIPANGSVAFPVGSTIVIYNNSGTAQNISITTDTLRLAGTATTGTRSLAQRGLATCVKVASTEWVVTGNVT